MYRLIAAGLLSLALVAGCSGGKSTSPDWTATVDVEGKNAVVTVDVPAKKLGKDYHPHVNLDGGPEVMMYNRTYTFAGVGTGEHRVKVAIADAQHQTITGMEKVLQFSTK